MTSIVLKHPWTRQPQYAARIDPGHPLSRGLVSCVLQTASGATAMVDIVNPGRIWNISNSSPLDLLATTEGKALYQPATGPFWNSTNPPFSPKNGCTIIFRYKPISSAPIALRAIVGFGHGTSTNAFLQISQTVTTGHLHFQMRDTANSATATISSSAQLTSDKFHSCSAWTDGTANHGLRINGISYTNSTSLGAFADPQYCTLMSLYRASQGNNGDGILIGPWMWNRVLSISEIDAMLSNPWQVFQPQRRFLPSFVVAGSPDVEDALTGSAATPGHGTASPVFSIGL